MNSRNMGKTILRLRKEKNMTQKELAEILEVSVDELLTEDTKADKWQHFKELNAADVKEMAGLLCRCSSVALSAGGLLAFVLGALSVSEMCILLCLAVTLLGIDSLLR